MQSLNLSELDRQRDWDGERLKLMDEIEGQLELEFKIKNPKLTIINSGLLCESRVNEQDFDPKSKAWSKQDER